MPSKNPRISVVLSPALAATLSAISSETGDSASSLVRGLLDQCQPALERMLALCRAANQAKGSIQQGAGAALGRAIDDLQDAQAVGMSRLDRVIGDLVDQAQAVKGRRRPSGAPEARRAVGVAPDPRPVTRGSGTGKTRTKRTVKGGRRGQV